MKAVARKPVSSDISARKRFETKSVLVHPKFNLPSTHGALLQLKHDCPCGGGCPRCKAESSIQPKLRIGEPNDQYEQEADRVAEQVMRMPDHEVAGVSHAPMKVQRKCTACASGEGLCPECAEEEEKIQAKEAPGQTPTVTPEVQTQIDSLRGGGQPLPESARRFFEPRFGHDFSRVRVHANSQAAESANAVKALAYTVGRDIVFGVGQYVPETSAGQRLLAHELTHVVQQRDHSAKFVQREPIGNDDPRYGGTLPYREAAALHECIRIMGEANAAYCRQEVLEEAQPGRTVVPPISTPPSPATPSPAAAPTYGPACSGGANDPCQRSRCSGRHSSINSDFTRAISYVDSAITALSASPLSSDTIRALDWYFNSHLGDTVRTIRTRLGCIRDCLNDTQNNSRYGCHPGDDALAYVCLGSTPACTQVFTNVCLTDQHFGKSDRVRAESMIHECAHRVGMSLGTPNSVDDIYDFTSRFLFLDTSEAILNSDSYALFAGAIPNGVRTTLAFPIFGVSAGPIVTSSGGPASWQARLYMGSELQHPILGMFNPTLGVGFSVIGETATQGLSPITAGPTLLTSLLAGVRISDPRPGAAGQGYASFFGGPALALGTEPTPATGIRPLPFSVTRVGAEAGAAIGYRWRWLDVSAGFGYIYDPTREEGMEHLYSASFGLMFTPEILSIPSSH